MITKDRVYHAMHSAGANGLNVFQRCLIAIIVASVLTSVLFSEPLIRDAVGPQLLWLEMVFGVAFLVEYLTRVWSAAARPEFAGIRGRLRYMRQPMAVVDLMAVMPFLIGLLGAESMVLRLVRLLRLLALSKLARYSTAMRLVLDSIASCRFELGFTVMLAGLIILISSAALYVAEGESQPEAFGSIPRAAWWAVTTLTTVGYGDLVPITPLGRILAALTAIAGVGLIAMPAGILAAAFSDAFARARSTPRPGAESDEA